MERRRREVSSLSPFDNIKYGISILPENCMAYSDGYRFGAYKNDLATGETHVVEFFKTRSEIQAFVNANPQYGKERG